MRVDDADSALLVDSYELSMLQSYFEQELTAPAVFELSMRHLPGQRGFLLFAGLEEALGYLERLRFTDAELRWLRSSGRFSARLVERLADFHFRGDVDAMPEGTVCFAGEPLLRVTASLPEAQFVETRLINLLHFETLIASKAARCVLAAGPGKLLVDFGLRRAHGAEAGVLAARASFLAGFSGTSDVLAGARWGIPVFGTMAHSYVEAFDDERDAFIAFARSQQDNVVLLIDTYDTEAAARKVARLAPVLACEGIHIQAVRLDSGNLARHARNVRRILDAGGCRDIRIFASGGLDEEAIAEHTATGVPIDGYGVGTRLVTSSDVPALDCAYKLVELAGKPRRKLSEGKVSWPGAKQVYRFLSPHGRPVYDEVCLRDEARLIGKPLLQPMMRGGKRLQPPTPLTRSREYAATQLLAVPPYARELWPERHYPVRISSGLRDLAESLAPTASDGSLSNSNSCESLG
jgi:nicotinate phosphoribosyltransferase